VTASTAAVGTPEYAQQAHTLAQLLFETGEFTWVEADVPVRAYERPDPDPMGAFAVEPDPPGSDLNWAREAIRAEQAWLLPLPAGGQARGQGIRIGHPDTGYTDHPGLGLSALDLTTDRDVISNDDDALDPLVPPNQSPWPLPNPDTARRQGRSSPAAAPRSRA
jgi:hypothetical protein